MHFKPTLAPTLRDPEANPAHGGLGSSVSYGCVYVCVAMSRGESSCAAQENVIAAVGLTYTWHGKRWGGEGWLWQEYRGHTGPYLCNTPQAAVTTTEMAGCTSSRPARQT